MYTRWIQCWRTNFNIGSGRQCRPSKEMPLNDGFNVIGLFLLHHSRLILAKTRRFKVRYEKRWYIHTFCSHCDYCVCIHISFLRLCMYV